MLRRGFTLIELSLVLAVMAIVITLAVPGYEAIVLRARAAEAQVTLDAIAHAELQQWRDGHGFLACGNASRFDPAEECWKRLGLRFEGQPRFAYRVELHGDSFVAFAEADLDGDGIRGVHRLDGRTLAVSSEAPLE